MTLSLRDAIAQYFRDHPHEWIDGMVLEGIGGRYAWRSRVSDARLELGMTIENRVVTVVRHTEGCPRKVQRGKCTCGAKSYKRSEYQYVPPGAPQQASLFKGAA